MVCRNETRGNAAREEIIAKTNNSKVYLLVGDCGLERDINRIVDDFKSHRLSILAQNQEKVSVSAIAAGTCVDSPDNDNTETNQEASQETSQETNQETKEVVVAGDVATVVEDQEELIVSLDGLVCNVSVNSYDDSISADCKPGTERGLLDVGWSTRSRETID